MRAVQHCCILGIPVADADVCARLTFKETGEILGSHARHQVALDVGIAGKQCRCRCRNRGFWRRNGRLNTLSLSPLGGRGDPRHRLVLPFAPTERGEESAEGPAGSRL